MQDLLLLLCLAFVLWVFAYSAAIIVQLIVPRWRQRALHRMIDQWNGEHLERFDNWMDERKQRKLVKKGQRT